MTSESDSEAEEPEPLEEIKVGFMTPVRKTRNRKSIKKTNAGV